MIEQVPQWHPISEMPMIASILDAQVKDIETQWKNFSAAKAKPHVLDDEMLDRAIRLYTKTQEDTVYYKTQCKRWLRESLTDAERQEVSRLLVQSIKLQEGTAKLVELAQELKKGSINRILEMDEGELALAVLAGKLKFP